MQPIHLWPYHLVTAFAARRPVASQRQAQPLLGCDGGRAVRRWEAGGKLGGSRGEAGVQGARVWAHRLGARVEVCCRPAVVQQQVAWSDEKPRWPQDLGRKLHRSLAEISHAPSAFLQAMRPTWDTARVPHWARQHAGRCKYRVQSLAERPSARLPVLHCVQTTHACT